MRRQNDGHDSTSDNPTDEQAETFRLLSHRLELWRNAFIFFKFAGICIK
jgi:hypothetical protein